METRFGPMGQAHRNAAAHRDPYGGCVYHALGPYGGTAQQLTGIVSMKSASVTYLA